MLIGRRGLITSAAWAIPVSALAAKPTAKPQVSVVRDDKNSRVDIGIDGQPFTSFIWADSLKKPVLYPLRAASGQVVTRGWPRDPMPGDTQDHPHHVGSWFNYGDVNGIDFWGHSDAMPVKDKPRAGTIIHTGVKSARGGKGRGELTVTAQWLKAGDASGAPDKGAPLLTEETQFVFHASAGRRAVDRITTLAAVTGPVAFPDNKEGLFGLRLARGLEHADPKKLVKPVFGDPPSGLYTSSEGKTGNDAWGTRARWVMVAGQVDGVPVTVAILDHPKNPGHPTYWHARGYGLFAANPLGQKFFSKGENTLAFALPKSRAKVRFSYRILILDGKATPAALESEWQAFAK